MSLSTDDLVVHTFKDSRAAATNRHPGISIALTSAANGDAMVRIRS